MRYKDLLNTNDILRLLTEQLNINLKQMGRSIFFLCPFHSDKNPSCSFEPNRKIFTCFACGFKASDIFSFWTKYKNPHLINEKKLDESEIWKSLEEISQMGYFPLSILQEKKRQEQKEKNKAFYLLSLITDIYQHNLLTQPGREVLKYLQMERQLDQKTIDHFGLGGSISNWQLSNLLFPQKNDNFSAEDLLATNLVWITENNRVCDFFPTQHLIIPLANSEGKIVAFAARKIGEISAGEGKYKYLPSYQYYQKSSLLYNYNTVKKSRTEECYLVEGFFDVISLYKLGIENCLALLGTNLSETQIKLLIELKKRIILFLDSDKAGQEAMVNVAVKLLLKEVDCEVIKSNYEGDPDEICQQQNKESIQNILQTRENPYLFVLNHYFAKWEVGNNPQRISRFISEIAGVFRKFKSSIYDFLITKISSLTGWKKEEIEPHFIHWNFPSLYPRFLLISHGRELIEQKEKKIIYLCAKERVFWLFANKKVHFFLTKSNRTRYHDIYNYYISSHSHNSYLEKHSLSELTNVPGLIPNLSSFGNQKGKVIDITLQELDNVRKFLLNYE